MVYNAKRSNHYKKLERCLEHRSISSSFVDLCSSSFFFKSVAYSSAPCLVALCVTQAGRVRGGLNASFEPHTFSSTSRVSHRFHGLLRSVQACRSLMSLSFSWLSLGRVFVAWRCSFFSFPGGYRMPMFWACVCTSPPWA